jgi:TfoX/Sxy family transcriptional regulator of competence genes
MAYDEKLANRIRERFENVPKTREKQMMGGLTVMVNNKMCVGIFKGELMCRIDPLTGEEEIEKHGGRPMEMGGKKMNGFILVSEDGIKSKKQFDYWIDQSLAFNKFAKASKKRKKK